MRHLLFRYRYSRTAIATVGMTAITILLAVLFLVALGAISPWLAFAVAVVTFAVSTKLFAELAPGFWEYI